MGSIALLPPASECPPLLPAGASQPSCTPTCKSSLARELAAHGKFLPQSLFPSVLEINCRTRYVFPCSCCLLWLFFWQAGTIWSVADVCDHEHGWSGKVARGRRGSHHPLSITTLPSSPCHHLGSGSSPRDPVATSGHGDGQHNVSMLAPLLMATHSSFTAVGLFYRHTNNIGATCPQLLFFLYLTIPIPAAYLASAGIRSVL